MFFTFYYLVNILVTFQIEIEATSENELVCIYLIAIV